MFDQLSIFTAGLWGVAWPQISAFALIVGLCALAYFSPIGKRYFIEAAIVIAVGLGVYQYGLHQEANRCTAQQVAGTKHINKVVNKAVKHTRTKRAIAAPDPGSEEY